MARTGHKFTAQDSAGNVVGSTAVEVRRASDNSLATLFDAVSGGSGLTNPFNAGSDGIYEFFTEPDRYNVTIGSGMSAYTYPLDLVDGRSTLYFATRAEFVTWASGGGEVPNGALVVASGLLYEADSASTEISDLLGFTPCGALSVEHWGENTTPGTTDMTAAVNAALSYASSLNPIDDGSGWSVPVSLGCKVVAISDQGSRGIDARGLTGIELHNGELVAIGSWAPTNPIFEAADDGGAVRSRNITVRNVKFDAKHLCAGFKFENTSQCRMIDVDGTGFETFGVQSITKNTELRLNRVNMKQYVFGETGYNNQANRTARGFDMNTADFIMMDCVANYCGVCFYKGDGFNWQMIGCHAYNGTLTGTIDPDLCLNLVIDGPEGGVVTNFYNDNGIVKINADGMSASEGSNGKSLQLSGFTHNKNANGYQDHEIIITTTDTNNDLGGLSMIDHRFPVKGGNISFEGSGSFASHLRWEWIGCAQKDGTIPQGTTENFNLGGQLRADDNGNFDFGSFEDVTLRSDRNITLMADYNNDSGEPESKARLGTNGTIWHEINDTGFWAFGVGQATGGGTIARLSWSGDDFLITPTDKAGSLDFDKQFKFDAVNGRWQVEGLFNVTNRLDVNGEVYIGNGNATGGEAVGRVGYAGDKFRLVPTNQAGSYNFNRELFYDPDGDAIWTAEGGFKTTSFFYSGASAHFLSGATGGAYKLRISSSGDGVRVTPTDQAGGYDSNKRIEFDPDNEGMWKINGGVSTGSTTVASLPGASTAGAGARHFVTDANATTFNSVVAGGGSNGVPVFSDGTNWRIG